MLEFTVLFVLFYIWHALGITIGYHRLLSHRTFRCSKFMEYFFVLPGYLAFEGSPIWWASIHRAHHKHVDTELDPHSPRFGLLNAHFGWLMQKSYEPHIDPERQAKDLVSDPVYRFLEQGGSWTRAHTLTFAICFLFRLAIFLVFGWIPALASLFAGLAVLQIPLMLNVICHIPFLGYQNFNTKEDSVNVWWVGILALGEGWHNNHHASPGSAKTGIRSFEVDVSWQLIRLMRVFGLVNNVNVISETKLLEMSDQSQPLDRILSKEIDLEPKVAGRVSV